MTSPAFIRKLSAVSYWDACAKTTEKATVQDKEIFILLRRARKHIFPMRKGPPRKHGDPFPFCKDVPFRSCFLFPRHEFLHLLFQNFDFVLHFFIFLLHFLIRSFQVFNFVRHGDFGSADARSLSDLDGNTRIHHVFTAAERAADAEHLIFIRAVERADRM